MRHGETPLNRDGLLGGSTDSPLTALGEQQARDAAPYLRRDWSLVATSQLRRARRTAELAVPGCAAVPFTSLNERDWGHYEGASLERQPPYEATPPGGESWTAFQARVVEILNGLLERHERPLIVAHSGVFRVIRTQLFGSPYGERIGNAEPVSIEPTAGGWHIRSLKR